MPNPLASELEAAGWLNAQAPIHLAALRGQVVLLHAFQMLCPGCVSHALPQVQRVQEAFRDRDLAIIGLHSVFEHHAAMNPQALAAFVHEYRLDFPIAIDRHEGTDPVPLSMRAYGLRGTPSLLLIDRTGRIRLHHFGRLDDLRLGALLGELLGEDPDAARAHEGPAANAGDACDEDACPVPSGRS
jgi:peroxiredoxin